LGYGYNYVFHYTDHLGNIRLSYGLDPATGTVSIMEENHYYPFGLKYTNYNSDQLEYSKTATDNVALQVSPLAIGGPVLGDEFGFLGYNYKFQGRELQDELGLNLYTFKWRSYNPTLGRFISMIQLLRTTLITLLMHLQKIELLNQLTLKEKNRGLLRTEV